MSTRFIRSALRRETWVKRNWSDRFWHIWKQTLPGIYGKLSLGVKETSVIMKWIIVCIYACLCAHLWMCIRAGSRLHWLQCNSRAKIAPWFTDCDSNLFLEVGELFSAAYEYSMRSRSATHWLCKYKFAVRHYVMSMMQTLMHTSVYHY